MGAVVQSPVPAAARSGTDGAGAAPAVAASPPKAETNIQSTHPETARVSELGTVKASPLARRMAQEHNIDLHQVQGTGPGGRIVRDDIEDYLEQAAPTPGHTRPPDGV